MNRGVLKIVNNYEKSAPVYIPELLEDAARIRCLLVYYFAFFTNGLKYQGDRYMRHGVKSKIYRDSSKRWTIKVG